MKEACAATPDTRPVSDVTESSPPRRMIFSEADMAEFRKSGMRHNLVQFVTYLGQSCIRHENATETATATYSYVKDDPLAGLSPSMACLHGSLRAMAELWLLEVPPDETAKRRFGNPAFRDWSERLTLRSGSIIEGILDCRDEFHDENGSSPYSMKLLEDCSERGYRTASSSEVDSCNEKRIDIVRELQSYLHSSFGHPIRLDYGTGHESSFFVFLYTLFKIGCFGSTKPGHQFAPVAISIVSQYLSVTRGLQSDYMLEPAGSHGVWGLDDYHCIPFYIGACQLVHNQQEYEPNSIHDRDESGHDTYMYFGCIKYIKSLKKGVPFFESSPMLNDISSLPSWTKVSRGLLRLYEGEVLDKRQAVQHFTFGDVFRANWTPSKRPTTPPEGTFLNSNTRAPWAK